MASQKMEIHRVAALCRDGQALQRFEALEPLFKKAGIEVCRGAEAGDAALGALGQPDVVIALGGDGTVLRALRLFPDVPVLPVNFGTLGFLTAGDEGEFEKLIVRLLAGDFRLEERLRLVCEFRGERRIVINEIVIKGATKMISVDVYIDGDLIRAIRGDGVIVGTPTGTTAYLLSTGSSIVAPQVQCLVVNGINEYRFANRSLILPPRSKVRLRVEESTRETELFVSHDGADKLPIAVGEELQIESDTKPLRFVSFDRHIFFRNLRSRLGW